MSRLLLIGAMVAVSFGTALAQGGASQAKIDVRSIVPLPAEIGADTVNAARRLWVGEAMAHILSDSGTTGRSVTVGPTR